MDCPQCGMDQPAGVTICGFCGAPVVALPLRKSAPAALPGTRSGQARPRRARWVLGLLAVAAVGAALWQAGRGAAPTPAAEPGAKPAGTEVRREAVAGGGERAAARGRPLALAGGRLSEEWLAELAAELEARAEAGDAAGLAALVATGARYRSTIEDASEVRRLDGGVPELVAHWLTPWLAAEVEGLSIVERIDVREVELAPGGESGRISRRIEPATDPSRVRFPKELLTDLARGRTPSAAHLERLDLGALDGVACRVDEGIQVGATPRGYRIVSVERFGSCTAGEM